LEDWWRYRKLAGPNTRTTNKKKKKNTGFHKLLPYMRNEERGLRSGDWVTKWLERNCVLSSTKACLFNELSQNYLVVIGDQFQRQDLTIFEPLFFTSTLLSFGLGIISKSALHVVHLSFSYLFTIKSSFH